MNYLTSSQYTDLTGRVLTGINNTYFDLMTKRWSAQANQLTGQNFDTAANLKTKVIRLKHCGVEKLNIGGWLTVTSVKVKTVGSTVWQTLVLNKDYTLMHPKFSTYVDGEQQDDPITGIDFSCLSCRCRCEEIEIVGDNRWSNGLPDELASIMLELAMLMLANDSNVYVSGNLPNNQLMKQVSQERDQTRSISWQRDENLQKLSNQKLANGFNLPIYTDLLMKYWNFNSNINQKFYA